MNNIINQAAALKQLLRTDTLSLIISLRQTIDEGLRLLNKLADVEMIAHKADDLYQDVTNDIISHGPEMIENHADAAEATTEDKETSPEMCDTSNSSDCS